MTSDEQEAKSYHFTHQLRMVLLLSSGKTAIFGHNREFLYVVDTLSELKLEQARPEPQRQVVKRMALNELINILNGAKL